MTAKNPPNGTTTTLKAPARGPVRPLPTSVMPPQPAKPVNGPVAQPPQAAKSVLPKPVGIKAFKASLLSRVGSIPFWAGLGFSAAWLVAVFGAIAGAGPAHTFAGVPLVNWAIGVSAVVSPIALVWMVAAYMQRAADVAGIAEPLRRQLAMITGESGAAEARIRRFNQVIREQIELLKSAQNLSKGDFITAMQNIRSHREELEHFENNSVLQVKNIQDIVRRNMQQIETLMDDKFTMLRILDDRLVQSGDSVARQTEAVRDHIVTLLEEVESHSRSVTDGLEKASRESKRLADTTAMQEQTLTSAAQAAAETLQSLSGTIDLSVARFLERAGSARSEAEQMAGALDAQTRSLEEFSNTLPARVGEAESIIRGVADRLYASEQLAREQAVVLSDKLSAQMDGLQGLLERFATRVTDADGTLTQRQTELDGVATRIGGATEAFAHAWEQSINGLNGRADAVIGRFTAVNEETRKGAEQVASHLSETVAKYEVSAMHMNKLSEESRAHMKEMTAEIASHLEQFEKLREASDKAGVEVQERATAAMHNLQAVLERLLSARDATAAIGESLVKDLYMAVDKNEHLITRLNEAAQMSVRAMGIASESLGKQQGDMAERTKAAELVLQQAAQQLHVQAQASEKGLREQAIGLMALLNETRGQIGMTEQNLQSLATRALEPVKEAMRGIDTTTDQGLKSLGKYGEGLNQQLQQLQQFHERVGGMGSDMTRVTTQTVETIEQLNQRFALARTLQEDAAKETLLHFADMSDRLQREVTGLEGQAAQAAELLQKAAASVGEQAYSLLQTSENAGAKIQTVSTVLQGEATQIHQLIHKQTEELTADMAHAEKQFTNLGEALKQRTDAAYALLDRVSTHYHETTRTVADDLDVKTQNLDKVASLSQGKIDALTASLSQQLNVIQGGTAQLETQAAKFSDTSGKTSQDIAALNEKIAFTHEVANANARQTLTKMDEVTAAFGRQGNAVADAANQAAAAVQKATTVFSEQTTKLLDGSHQADHSVKQLGVMTTTLADQATTIRTAMEQQNQRLVSQLTESVMKLEQTGAKLEQTTATALLGADQASSRFGDVVTVASTKLAGARQDMEATASKAETALTAVGAHVTQQAASLSVLGDQITEQHRALTEAGETQRAQLLDLFDKLGQAHGQASDVAERAMARLSESLVQIQKHLGSMADQAQSSVGHVRDASVAFGDQSVQLIHNAQAAEQQARNMVSVTSALQEQARVMHEQLQSESQRSGDALGGLINRLSSGGAEMRDLSTTTEMALGSLNATIGQQTQALHAHMSQLNDRQHSLTTALDAQRDVLNGLLQRLTLAQDETAVTAERMVLRLDESAQQVTRQMEGIKAQAQTALSYMQNATASFVDEAGHVRNEALQTEQQMRGMMVSASAMQDQVRTVREQVESESNRVVEQLQAAISKIDATGHVLQAQGAATNQMLDQTVLNFAAQTRTSSDEMLKQVDVLTQAVGTAEAKLSGASDMVRSHLRLVGEAGDQAEVKARQLADSAEYATNRLGALRTTLTEVDAQGEKLLEQASLRVVEAKEILRGELKILVDLSLQAVEHVNAASRVLAGEGEGMRNQMAMSESAIQQATSLLREEKAQLPALLGRHAEEIEVAVKNLKLQAVETDTTLVSMVDRFSGVTATARESMIDDMRRVGATADQANALIGSVAALLAEQVSALQTHTATLSTEQSMLVDKAGDSVLRLAAASDRLAQLRNEAAHSADRLTKDLDTLDQRANATAVKLVQSGDTVIKTVDALAQVTQRAETQLNDASSGFRDQLERIRTGLQVQIDDINRGLMQITAQLERTGTTLRTTTVGTVADVERISKRFEETSASASQQLTDKTARMRGATEEVAKLLSGFGDQMDVLMDRLAVAGDGIRRHEGDMVGQLQTALDHLGGIAGKLDEGRKLADEVSAQMAARLGDAAAGLRKEMESLAAGSQTAAGIMRGIGHIYTEQTQSLNTGVRDAHSQVQGMNKAIDDMQQRADRMRVALKMQGDELMGSLQQILSQLSQTGDALDDAVQDALKHRAEENLRKIG